MERNQRENINTQEYWNKKPDDVMGQPREYVYAYLTTLIAEDIEKKGLTKVRIFDVGCSAGQYLEGIKRRLEIEFPGIEMVFGGIDISDVAINQANKYLPNGHFYAGDVNAFIKQPCEEPWDYVISNHTFEHLENPDKICDFFMDNCSHLMLINVPYKTHIDNEEHIYYFDEESYSKYDDIKTTYLEQDGDWKTILFIFAVKQ